MKSECRVRTGYGRELHGERLCHWYVELEYLYRRPLSAIVGPHRNPLWLKLIAAAVWIVAIALLAT